MVWSVDQRRFSGNYDSHNKYLLYLAIPQFHEVRRCLTAQAVEYHDAELVHDSLRNIQQVARYRGDAFVHICQ